MSEQDEINAERARLNHEPEEGRDLSGCLDEVCNQISIALHWHWAHKQKLSPAVEKAKACIEECALDFPEELFDATKAAFLGNPGAGIVLMRRYIRTYAEAHLPELVEFFDIDTGDNREQS